MFRLIQPSSGQIQNIVLVHSVSAHYYGIPYCLQNYIDIKDHLLADVFKRICKISCDDGSMSRNMSPNF